MTQVTWYFFIVISKLNICLTNPRCQSHCNKRIMKCNRESLGPDQTKHQWAIWSISVNAWMIPDQMELQRILGATRNLIRVISLVTSQHWRSDSVSTGPYRPNTHSFLSFVFFLYLVSKTLIQSNSLPSYKTFFFDFQYFSIWSWS